MLYLCFHRSENGLRVTLGVIFDSLFAGLLLSSIFGILLLEIGTFSVGKLTTVLFVFSAVAGVLFLRKMPAASLALRPDKYKLMLVLVLLLACLLRFPPSNWVTGGQDQGVYVNIGNNMSRTGKIFIQDELLLEVSENDKVKEYYLKHTYKSVRKKVATKYAGKIEGKYTPGQIDGRWSSEIQEDFRGWLKKNINKLPVPKQVIEDMLNPKTRNW